MTATDRLPTGGRVAAGRSVVVADDNDGFRTMIAEYLEAHGFVVHQAANGLEAVLATRQTRPAAVVLDLLMPRLSGLEALNRIRAFAPTVRVVVVTAAGDAAMRRQALQLGAVALLAKPIDLDGLVEILSVPTLGAGEPARPGEPRRPVAAGHTVLVVDDEAEVRSTLEDFLRAEGYEVHTAADASQALALVQAHSQPVVLLDIVMPGLGGIEALAMIRGMAPAARVIMVSALGDQETARRALAYGAFDYLAKPVDLDRLAAVLAAAFVQR